MKIAIDYDGTLVQQNRAYNDLSEDPEWMPHAVEAVNALKSAGHTLILYSARANRALRIDPRLNPLARGGRNEWWLRNQTLNESRYQAMRRHVEVELPGIFDAIDDGRQGKPSADMFIDDRAVRFGAGVDSLGWAEIGETWGDTADELDASQRTTLPAPEPAEQAEASLNAVMHAMARAHTAEGREERLRELRAAHIELTHAIETEEGPNDD